MYVDVSLWDKASCENLDNILKVMVRIYIFRNDILFHIFWPIEHVLSQFGVLLHVQSNMEGSRGLLQSFKSQENLNLNVSWSEKNYGLRKGTEKCTKPACVWNKYGIW